MLFLMIKHNTFVYTFKTTQEVVVPFWVVFVYLIVINVALKIPVKYELGRSTVTALFVQMNEAKMLASRQILLFNFNSLIFLYCFIFQLIIFYE